MNKPSPIFHEKMSLKYRDLVEQLRLCVVNGEVSSNISELLFHLHKASMNAFFLREALFFRGDYQKYSAEKVESFCSVLLMCEHKIRSAINDIEMAPIFADLTDKGKQILKDVDKAVAEAKDYNDLVQRLHKIDQHWFNL